MTDVNFRARLVLLGASNVTKGISIIIETAQHMFGSPLDVYCAIGHGRSYGKSSFVLVRSLPSILDSRLWEAIGEGRDEIPTYALVADVGNDVMYGPPPQQIAAWVDTCVDRLARRNARIVMTSLPIERIERLSERQYFVARSLLFPTNRLTLAEARDRATEVIERLESLAEERHVPLVELPGSWYGTDPIHFRPTLKPEAWGTILARWRDGDAENAQRAKGSLRRLLRIRSLSPEQWWLLGRFERGRPQPAATLADGTRISMY